MTRLGSRSELTRAREAIERAGILLVYPIQNRTDPPSLWHALHPRSPMRWTWDANADPRVVALWHQREELARSRLVVYGKWYQGRATFFSRDVFRAMLATLRALGDLRRGLSRESLLLLELLEDDSPQPTRALRERADLAGRLHEAAYSRAMRALFARLLVVGAGEVEEGGFPSLAIGATELLHEDLWTGAATLTAEDASRLAQALAQSTGFTRAFRRVRGELARNVQ